MMNRPRTVFTPTISQKRRDRDEPFLINNSNKKGNEQRQRNIKHQDSIVSPSSHTTSLKQAAATAAEPEVMSNRLLAGYMAHEFLTKGTILGEKFDPARADAVPPYVAAEAKRKPNQSNNYTTTTSSSSGEGTAAGLNEAEPMGVTTAANKRAQENESYGKVATLLKTEGPYIPGIVNPTQLARWIKM